MSGAKIQSGVASIAPAAHDTIESILTTAGISKAEQADILIDYIHSFHCGQRYIPKIGDHAALIRDHFAFWLLCAWTNANELDETKEDYLERTIGFSENTLKALRAVTFANMKLVVDRDIEECRKPDE